MNRINIQRHQSEIGELLLGSFGYRLCLIGFGNTGTRGAVDDRIRKKLDAEFVEHDHEILEKTRRQLDEYLEGVRKKFEIPVLMVGTEFQRGVWNVLMKVSYGCTSTYLQLAKEVGSVGAVRAVANAIAANPISIVVPCHRVIGSNGELVGYGGGLALKRWLLKLEQGDNRPHTG
jgi:methylated-DNA-[protein]-cysteine S-methyltransferase